VLRHLFWSRQGIRTDEGWAMDAMSEPAGHLYGTRDERWTHWMSQHGVRTDKGWTVGAMGEPAGRPYE